MCDKLNKIREGYNTVNKLYINWKIINIIIRRIWIGII